MSIGSCIWLKSWILPLIAILFEQEESCNKQDAKSKSVELLDSHLAVEGNLCVSVLAVNDRMCLFPKLCNDSEKQNGSLRTINSKIILFRNNYILIV